MRPNQEAACLRLAARLQQDRGEIVQGQGDLQVVSPELLPLERQRLAEVPYSFRRLSLFGTGTAQVVEGDGDFVVVRSEAAAKDRECPAVDGLRLTEPAQAIEQGGVSGAIEPGDGSIGPVPTGAQPYAAPGQRLSRGVTTAGVLQPTQIVVEIGQLEVGIPGMTAEGRQRFPVVPASGGVVPGGLGEDAKLVVDRRERGIPWISEMDLGEQPGQSGPRQVVATGLALPIGPGEQRGPGLGGGTLPRRPP